VSRGKLAIPILMAALLTVGVFLYLYSPRLHVPGKDGIDGPWGWFPDNYIELRPGEEKEVTYRLEVLSDVPNKENYFLVYAISSPGNIDALPLPQGLEVSPPSFEEEPRPNENYTLTVTIRASPDLAPGEYYIYIDGRDSIAGDSAAIMPHGKKNSTLTINVE